MKLNSIINRYIFREMTSPFLINLVLFTFVFLMAETLRIADLIVNYGISVFSVLLVLIYSIPTFLVYVLPMSIMMGVLLAFLRLSNDNELLALKAGGVGIYDFLPPALAFCLAGSLLTGFVSIYASPWGRLSFKSLLLDAAMSNIEIALKERTFNDGFKNVMLYVSEIDRRNNTLVDVFLEDRQEPDMVSTVVAPKGKFFFDPKAVAFRLTLYNGVINQVDQGKRRVHSLGFDTYDFRLELARVLSAARNAEKGRKEMSFGELREVLSEGTPERDNGRAFLMEYHRRFSIPFACFVLGLVAVPLGIQSRVAKRSYGMVLGLFFFLIYYVLLTAGWILGEEGICAPVIAVWGPDLIVGAVGVYLLIMSAKERRVKVLSLLPRVSLWPKSVWRN